MTIVDPLDAYSSDEIGRAVGGERFGRNEPANVPQTFCIAHLIQHEPDRCPECRQQARAQFEVQQTNTVTGRRSKRSHWPGKPPWAV